MNRTLGALAMTACLTASAAPAQEVSIGVGYAAFNAEVARDGALLSVGYRSAPFGRFLGADAAWGAVADVTDTGDIFLGAGVGLRWPLGERFFVQASVAPGFYRANEERNLLGGNFQFRSTLGVGWRFAETQAVSLSVSHKSNAHIRDFNPGLESLFLSWHIAY